MKKNSALVFILALSTYLVSAQENTADSLFNRSKKYWYNNIDSSRYLLNEALRISRQAHYLKGEANALKGLGFLANSNIERLQFYFQALDIRQKINDSLGIGISLHDIGLVYRSLEEIDKSLTYNNRAIAIRRQIKDYGGIAQSLIELGKIEETSGEFEKALQTYRESLHYRLKAGEVNGIAYSHINIAFALAKLNRCDSVFFYCSLAEKEFSKVNNQTVSNWINLIRGKCYAQSNQEALAINELSKIDSSNLHFPEAMLQLSSIYERQQNFKQALLCQKKWMNANKIVEGKTNTKAARELAADYEYKIQQTESARKEEMERTKKKRQDNLQLMLIAIGLIAAFVLFVSVRKQFSERTVNVFTFVGFMFLFEFIVVLIDPTLQTLSGNKPVLLLVGNTIVALAIAPLHSFVEKYFKKKMNLELPT